MERIRGQTLPGAKTEWEKGGADRAEGRGGGAQAWGTRVDSRRPGQCWRAGLTVAWAQYVEQPSNLTGQQSAGSGILIGLWDLRRRDPCAMFP